MFKLIHLDWEVPDFSTLCRRQKALSACIPYRGSTGPPHLLIDGISIKDEGEDEWKPASLERSFVHQAEFSATMAVSARSYRSNSLNDPPSGCNALNEVQWGMLAIISFGSSAPGWQCDRQDRIQDFGAKTSVKIIQQSPEN